MNNLDRQIKAISQIRNAQYEPSIDDLSCFERNILKTALESDIGLVRPSSDRRTLEEADVLLKAWANTKHLDRAECRQATGAIKGSTLGKLHNSVIARKSLYVEDIEDHSHKLIKSVLACPPQVRKFIDHHYIDRFTDKYKFSVSAIDDEGRPYKYMKTPPLKIHARDNLKVSWRSYSEQLKDAKRCFIANYGAI